MEWQAAEIREAIDAIHLDCGGTIPLIPHGAVINELENLTLVVLKELQHPTQKGMSNVYTTWGGEEVQVITILKRWIVRPEEMNGHCASVNKSMVEGTHTIVLGDTK